MAGVGLVSLPVDVDVSPVLDSEVLIVQIVRITNHLRDEHGITGTVVSISRDDRLVKLKNRSTGKTYQRAWWNLESATATETGTRA